jgi:hypothetical protein
VNEQARVLGDRFLLLAPLGSGAMGDVYRARDRARDQDVALKLLPELDATALLRFKHEFRALHDVEHPNLVRLHELHEDRGTWFFTMQLVDGVDVLTWMGDDAERLRIVAPQIARAMHRLHCEGLVHRDVKPSNVLVTRDGTAKLLDFGLVAPTWSPGEGAGTPAFMAPEQVAGDISPAADWYAFGALMFRALTGRLPFVGCAEEVMRAKTERPAPRVRQIRDDAPADLAALADALLERSPTKRPNGATILAALGSGAERRQVAHEVLVGRERELAALRDAVAERMAGAAIALAIVGESGIGKTTLLRELEHDLAAGGTTWVLRGRCWERESVPYKGLDGVIDELATRLEEEDIEIADAGSNAILAQAFPALRRVRGFASQPAFVVGGGRTSSAHVARGVRSLFAEVAAHRPLVVLVDDLQWADHDTLSVLRALVRPVPNVLIGYAARSPIELGPDAAVRTIALEPLSEADTARLVELIGEELGGNLDANAVAREVGGHPLFARELARHVVETGETGPISFEDVVRRLTERFGEDARRIATIICLAHLPLAIEATAHAANASVPAFFDAIATLRGARFVATSGVGAMTRLEPYHDRIRQTLIERLSATELRELHERIARALDATGSTDHAALARHWECAGERSTAARHAIRAAEAAEAALAFHRAAELYTYALTLEPTLEIRVRQAETLAQAGRGVDAADAFLACARDATGAEALDLRRRAMQQLLLMGHNDRALVLLDELMRELGLPNPTRPGHTLLRLVRSRIAIRAHRPVLPPEKHLDVPLIDRVRLDVLWDAAAGLAFVDPLRSFFLHSLELQLGFRIGDGPRLARSLLGEAPYLAASGKQTRRLENCLALGDRVAARASFPALPELARSAVAFLCGRWRECRAHATTVQRLLEQDRPRLVKEGLGPAHLQDMLRRFELAAMYYEGDFRLLRDRVVEHLQDALDRHDVTSATHLRSGVITGLHLAFGDVDAAMRDAEEGFHPWRDRRVGVPHFMDLQSRTMISIYRGGGDAYRDILADWPSLKRAHLMRAQFIEISLFDMRGRAALAAESPADASRCASRLHATGAGWGAPLGIALEAGVAIARRDLARARSLLVRAASGFDAAGMRIHAENARFVLATLAEDVEAMTRAREALSSSGIADVDRYSRLLLPRWG